MVQAWRFPWPGLYPITIIISNLTMMMNTNTELPKNARMLTKEEADDWDKICSDFGPIFLEVDGEIREFERISSCPSPVLGKGFLVLAVSCPEWGKEKLMIVARCKEGKERA